MCPGPQLDRSPAARAGPAGARGRARGPARRGVAAPGRRRPERQAHGDLQDAHQQGQLLINIIQC